MPVKTSLHEQIGQRIANIRREAGLTQQDLAETVGVSRSAVAQWETGRAGQLIPNLTAIAQALGVGNRDTDARGGEACPSSGGERR